VADIHCKKSLPYVLKTGMKLEDFIFQTDKHNVKGCWEWENATVRVVELPSSFREDAVITILERLVLACQTVINTPARIKFSGAPSECIIAFIYVTIF